MVRVKFKVLNKCLTSYGVVNLTNNTHRSPYGLYGVVKNQELEGFGVIKDDFLYITWSIGGCTMLMLETATELGFEISNLIINK
jgi:hypothetical protein